jgi:hypothetical protein
MRFFKKNHLYQLTLTVIGIVLLTSTGSLAQPAAKDLDTYMKSLRQNSAAPVPQSVFADSKNEKKIYKILQPYFNDTLALVRSRAYGVAKLLGQKSNDLSFRKGVVHDLVLAIRDKDSGISGIASESLSNFTKVDFSEVDRDSIGRLIRPSTPHLPQVIKLAGYLDLQKFQPDIYQIVNSKSPFQNKWAARLALARMGDNQALTYFRNKLPKAPINDDFVYEIVPDLVYTRQKEIFVFLESIIHSQEKNCQSPNPDSSQKIECGHRVMEALAPAIENFPFTVDATGTLITDDYAAALVKVREWLRQNPDYKIKSDSF